jgi:hypothetical protein
MTPVNNSPTDIFRRTPIWTTLRLFTGVYYAIAFANLGRTIRATRKRAANIRAEPDRLTTG